MRATLPIYSANNQAFESRARIVKYSAPFYRIIFILRPIWVAIYLSNPPAAHRLIYAKNILQK